jgi:hypothetical protein
MTTHVLRPTRSESLPEAASAGIYVRPVAYPLSISLAATTLIGAGLSFLLPDLLGGPDVMNGSVRGTGLILSAVTVPAMLAAMWFAARGSTVASLVWVGAVAHVLYQSVLFLFGTPFNELFLVYVAMGVLGIWSAVALLAGLDAEAVTARITPGLQRKPIAIYVWVVVALNALAWLARVVPELASDEPAFLVGTGLSTNPVFVNDLTIWLPLMAIGAWWLWRDRAWGYVTIGAMLVMWQVEAVTVAVDQWMGSNADPSSDVATMAGASLFVAMTLINVPPLVAFFRHVRRTRGVTGATSIGAVPPSSS